MEILDWKIMNTGLRKEINNDFILYGASEIGEQIRMLLHDIGLDNKILAVVDSDEKKWGVEWAGKYKISCPEIINSYTHDVIIVIASIYLYEIFQYLHDKLKCSQNICSSFSLRHAIHYDIINDNHNYLENKVVEIYKEKYNIWKDNENLKNFIKQEFYFTKMLRCVVGNPSSILLCGMAKTGNNSLLVSFKEKEYVNISFTFHVSYYNSTTLKSLKKTLKFFCNNNIKIITGVREPIERIISEKWEGISYPYDSAYIPELVDEHYQSFITNLLEYEKNNKIKFCIRNCQYDDSYNWFNDHIKKAFGIDVFEYPFDKDNGYSIIKKDNISVFIYRLDKLSNLEEALREFSGRIDFKLKNANIASEKRYAFAYRQYLEQVKIKKEFYDSLVNSKGMTHFYTEKECEEYRDKWKSKLIY